MNAPTQVAPGSATFPKVSRQSYVKAWVAETGFNPSDCALVEHTTIGGDTAVTQVQYRPQERLPRAIGSSAGVPAHWRAEELAKQLYGLLRLPIGCDLDVLYRRYPKSITPEPDEEEGEFLLDMRLFGKRASMGFDVRALSRAQFPGDMLKNYVSDLARSLLKAAMALDPVPLPTTSGR